MSRTHAANLRRSGWLWCGWCLALAAASPVLGQQASDAPRDQQAESRLPQVIERPGLIHRVQKTRDRVDMVVNTSLILHLDHRIPNLQVDNPEVLTLTPLSPNQVQIHAKKTGITSVSLWDDQKRIFTVEVSVLPDAKELTELLRAEFRGAAITVRPTSTGVIVGGYVDRPEDVNRIVTLAQQYYPNVINNIRVGGTPQVILHVKVMEVSRSKLRDFGVDFTDVFNSGSGFFSSTAAGLGKVTGIPQVVSAGSQAITGTVGAVGSPTLSLGVVNPSNGFFLFIAALQRNQLLKVLAEPTLVTVSGRPAYFQSGGEIPIPIPQSLGTVSIQFRKFGTQVDFVPIVLGNGRIRLEVRPKISEIDNTVSITLNGTTIPGFRTREVDTGVEMMAGQTLALAGLIQTRVETTKQGIPYLMDMPYVGVPFRRLTDQVNEIELLITVRPELAEAMDCDQVPPIGPGVGTTVPDDCGLYWKGYTEVPVDAGGPGPGPGAPRGSVAPPMGGPGAAPGMPAEMELLPPGRPANNPFAPSAANRPAGSRAMAAGSAQRRLPERTAEPVGTSDAPPARTPAQAASTIRNNRTRPQAQQPEPATKYDSDPPAFIGPTGYDLIN